MKITRTKLALPLWSGRAIAANLNQTLVFFDGAIATFLEELIVCHSGHQLGDDA